jgi:putative ABC transport system substrate-binding protein
VAAFRQGLSEAGKVEGRDVTIEYRWAEGQNDRLPGLVADLVRRQVAIIVTTGIPETLAAKAATRTIPIVFQVGVDPADIGIVPSLNRPGGNLTGVTNFNAEVGPKRLELLRELLPTAPVMALLVNPTNPTAAEILWRDVQAAAHLLGLQLHRLQASNDREIDDAFASLLRLRASALVIAPDVHCHLDSRKQHLMERPYQRQRENRNRPPRGGGDHFLDFLRGALLPRSSATPPLCLALVRRSLRHGRGTQG